MYVVAVWDLNQVKLYENDILVGVTDLQGSLAQNTFNGSAGIELVFLLQTGMVGIMVKYLRWRFGTEH